MSRSLGRNLGSRKLDCSWISGISTVPVWFLTTYLVGSNIENGSRGGPAGVDVGIPLLGLKVAGKLEKLGRYPELLVSIFDWLEDKSNECVDLKNEVDEPKLFGTGAVVELCAASLHAVVTSQL